MKGPSAILAKIISVTQLRGLSQRVEYQLTNRNVAQTLRACDVVSSSVEVFNTFISDSRKDVLGRKKERLQVGVRRAPGMTTKSIETASTAAVADHSRKLEGNSSVRPEVE